MTDRRKSLNQALRMTRHADPDGPEQLQRAIARALDIPASSVSIDTTGDDPVGMTIVVKRTPRGAR